MNDVTGRSQEDERRWDQLNERLDSLVKSLTPPQSDDAATAVYQTAATMLLVEQLAAIHGELQDKLGEINQALGHIQLAVR